MKRLLGKVMTGRLGGGESWTVELSGGVGKASLTMQTLFAGLIEMRIDMDRVNATRSSSRAGREKELVVQPSVIAHGMAGEI